jgi:serine phosphatase RsbU (regulator of sigma subunit)
MTDAVLLHLTESSPEPLHSQIARQLRDRVLSGDLPEGCELPAAQRLAREHRVSPRVVQQAFEALAAEGLLARDGDAVRVATVSAEQRRALAQRRLLDDLRQQELSLRELELARDIQRRLLPPARVDCHGLTVTSRWLPARFVAGDFYDVLRHPDGGVGVVVADVAGKGIGASVIMASVKAMAPFIAAELGVADTLRELNRRLCGELGKGQFVALAYARFSPDAATVELANAGMPDPFVVQDDGRPVPLEVPGPRLPLGIRAGVPYVSVTRPLAARARMLLFSDGIAEARRPSGEPLGYEGLAAVVAAVAAVAAAAGAGQAAAGEWLDAVLDEVQRLTGPALDDDWTAVLVERSGGQEAPRPATGGDAAGGEA